MIGFIGKIGKIFCNINKKYTQYFKTSDNVNFITSDGKTLKTQPVYYNFKTSTGENIITSDGKLFKIKD